MPQLGLGTEIGRVSGGAYDSDALAYFARAGIASGTQTPSSYDNAASFNGTNQFLSIPSNSSLTVTGTSFTYAFWANAVNTTPLQLIVVKQDAPGNLREYQMFFANGNIQFDVFPDGNFSSRKAVVQIAGPVNSWNFYVCRYDSSGGGTIGISINGSAFNSVGSVGAITQTHSNPLQIGANPGPNNFFSGGISSVGFWKRALTASEVTALWNSGAGRTYASLDSGLRNNLVSWWALNQNSVTADSHGTNTLTNNGTVTAPNIGPIVTTTQNSRQLINNFVKGIKSLGLWNQMVCWPLRASQNASTTLTARSLGGLGTYDGSLFGLATSAWGANGLAISNPSFGSDNQRVDLPAGIGLGGANIYSYGAGTITSGANLNLILDIQNNSANTRNPFFIYGYQPSTQFLQCDLISGSNTAVSALRTNATIPLNAFGSATAGVVGNTLTVYNNTTAGPTATSPGGWSPPPAELTRGLGRLYNGTLSMVVLGRFEAPATLVTNLNNLYKQTLLLGLGLP